MKLGCFYGLTAPFMVMLCNEVGKESMESLARPLDNQIDVHKITDMKDELYYFSEYLETIPTKAVSPIIESFSDEEERIIIEYGIYSDITFVGKVKRMLAIESVQAMLSVKYLRFLDASLLTHPINSNSIRMDVINAVTSVLESCRFSISINKHETITKVVRKFINRREVKEPYDSDCMKALMSAFKLSIECGDSIKVRGIECKINDVDKKIIQYFLENKNLLEECQSVLSTKNSSYNSSLSQIYDIANRRPEHLFSIVIKTFKDTLKDGSVRRVNDKLREEIAEIKRKMRENIEGVNYNKDSLDKATALRIASSRCGEDSVLYNAVISDELDFTNITAGTMRLLADVYNHLGLFSISGLNEKFGVSLDEQSWEDEIAHLREIGFYGINLYTKELFHEFLKTSALCLSKYVMDNEKIERFRWVFSEIDALLNTIQPIGGVINE